MPPDLRFGAHTWMRCALAAAASAAVGVEGLADEPRQGGEVVAAVVAAAVDEEAGGAGDPAQVGAVDVGGDARCVGALAEVVREAPEVEPELVPVPFQVTDLERVLMGHEEVVHGPERP